ncbi:MAG TPA: MoaD/ThiS family protein [Planctomycetota bacterium]|nr:MoaD/ThiS family protein [Planctomycetota bacterium]
MPISISIRIPSMLAKYAGGERVIRTEGATVRDALADVPRRHPDLGPRLVDASGALHPYFHLFRNGERLEGAGAMTAALRDGDSLEVLAAASGG